MLMLEYTEDDGVPVRRLESRLPDPSDSSGDDEVRLLLCSFVHPCMVVGSGVDRSNPNIEQFRAGNVYCQ
jgi:hypothetical protein